MRSWKDCMAEYILILVWQGNGSELGAMQEIVEFDTKYDTVGILQLKLQSARRKVGFL